MLGIGRDLMVKLDIAVHQSRAEFNETPRRRVHTRARPDKSPHIAARRGTGHISCKFGRPFSLAGARPHAADRPKTDNIELVHVRRRKSEIFIFGRPSRRARPVFSLRLVSYFGHVARPGRPPYEIHNAGIKSSPGRFIEK
ncbi:hypothetical protein EVAR_20098_1 [Eumeta japonica]|uniref:Uncharacterized protein n=1 Tax=Eumeta variegata TaxID=151549 RepID=A0A4C1V2A3_EUMVA|nr:hypothetical protein EVAR_20098_1 [Eumeta japonica]